MSVLEYVINRMGLAAEPAATQALAYILDSEPTVAEAFTGILKDTGFDFAPGRIEAEQGHGEARPDLTVRDSDGRIRVFVENKFWAGLTPAQPVSYLETLKTLSKGQPSALMFIVPEQRITAVWPELVERCKQSGLKVGDEQTGQGVIWNRIGCRIMLITSWRYILEKLLDAARNSGNENIKHDILQLQRLTEREDSEAFLPLREDQVTDQEIARRLINYSDLFDPIINELERIGGASKKGFHVSYGPYHTGRFFGVAGKFQLWLGVYLKSWRDNGITPLWCEFHRLNSEAGINEDHFSANPELIAGAQFYGGGRLMMPIRLKTGVERERVIEDAATQIKRIADVLLEAPPTN